MRVSEDGEIIDTYNKLTKVFECPDFYFFERLKKETETVSHDYYESWKCLYDKLKYDIDIPFQIFMQHKVYINIFLKIAL